MPSVVTHTGAKAAPRIHGALEDTLAQKVSPSGDEATDPASLPAADESPVAPEDTNESPPQNHQSVADSAVALQELTVGLSPSTPPPGAVAEELDRFARRTPHQTDGPKLSPNLTAAIGGLLGLTVVTSLGIWIASLPSTEQAASKQEAPAVADPPAPQPPEKERAPQRKKLKGPWRVSDDAQKPGHHTLRGKIGKVAFLTAIQDAGLPKSEAYRAYAALKGELDLDHCRSSDTFAALVQGNDKTLVGFEYIKSKEEVYQAKPNEQGRLVGQRLDLKVDRNQIRRAFVHDGHSFEDSARNAGFDPGIAALTESTLRGHAALSDFKRGDRFRIIAQEVTVLGEFSRYSGIEAMEILRKGQEPRRIYYFSHPVEGGHFDKQGRAPYEGGWRKPIPTAPRTSKFNPKRMHPVLKRVMPHNGTDFGAPAGTPIGATAPGTISFIGMAGRSGNLVKVKHDGGYESGYAHMSRFVPGLKVGDRVERMQVVGYCGSTGSSTAPHLHFSIKKDGVFIDPESLNLDGLRVLPKSYRVEFEKVQAKYDPILNEVPLPKIETTAPPESAPTNDDAPLAADSGSQAPSPPPSAPLGGPAPQALSAEPTPAKSPAASEAVVTPAAHESGQAAKVVPPSAIFLSDAELLKMQSLTDDGEISAP